MRKWNLLLIAPALLAMGCSGDEKKNVMESHSQSGEVPGPSSPSVGDVAWEADYRCPVIIDKANKYTDEEGYSTFADSSFAAFLIDAVQEGRIRPVNDKMEPLDAREVKEALVYVKSVKVEEEPGISQVVSDTMNLHPDQVVEILTREKWIVDRNDFKLHKVVQAYAPVVNTYDDNGNLRGKKILFWVKN